MTRTKSSRALLSVVLAVLMVAAFMPALTYSSFAATAKKATKVTKLTHTGAKVYGKVGNKYVLKYKLSPSKLTSAAKKTVWKSSDSSIVKVYSTKSNRAAVKAKAEGTAKVTVYTKANKKAKTTWKFKVVEKKAPAQKVAATGVTVAADNSDDYTKTLKAGTTLTATVAPANATGVTYQWYADGTAISGATSQKFKVTTDQIGKEISVKATDDSKNTIESTKSAKVSDVTLTGVGLYKVNSDKTTAAIDENKTYAVGTELNVLPTSKEALTGASKLSDIAAIKWIRTIYSANGTAQETTVAENTNTYTITKADLAAMQNGAKVTIKAEVTPNTGVKTYGTKSGKYTTDAARINGDFVVSIQANGKDVTTSVKAGTKLTAVTTPSDVKVTYQWYKDGKQIAGATSAEYTPTADGTYRVHAEVAKDETTYNKSAHADATVKVGGKEITKVDVKAYDKATDTKEATAVTPKSVLKAYPEWVHTAELNSQEELNKHVTYQWYRNGVKLTDADAKDGKVATVTSQKLDLNQLKTVVTTNDSFYCVVTGDGETFLSDPVTSNTVKVANLGTIDASGVHAYLFGNTLYANGLKLNNYNAKVVAVTKTSVDTIASETTVDETLDNHVTNTDAKTQVSTAKDQLRDLTDAERDSLYLKLDGTSKGYTGTAYVQVTNVKVNIYQDANAKAYADVHFGNDVKSLSDLGLKSIQWQYYDETAKAWKNMGQDGNNTTTVKTNGATGNYKVRAVAQMSDGSTVTSAEKEMTFTA